MEQEVRALITVAAAVVLAITVLIPVTRRMAGGSAAQFQRFKEAAIADGRAVTAYIGQRKQRRGPRDAQVPSQRKPYVTARYTYSVFPGGKKYQTKVFSGQSLPDQLQLYLYPGNPKRYRTEGDIRQGGFTALHGLLAYLAFGAAVAAIYHILGFFTA